MEQFQISEETKNKILLYTAKSLPDRPSEKGMKAQDIKVFFYKYIGVLIEAINGVFAEVISGVSADIKEHNGDENSHTYLLKYIEYLQQKDAELGNSIGSQISAHNASEKAHSDIRTKIISDINAHNASENAHSDIRELIATLDTLAHDAYNLAIGKSKVHPCEGISTLLSEIESGELILYPGDMVIFKETNLPDLAVFATGQESIPEEDIEMSFKTALEEKQSYYFAGITFVALENGIDTSKLVSTVDLVQVSEHLISTINELKNSLDSTEKALSKKEDKLKEVESTDVELLLATHTEYNLGLVTELMITLPANTDGLEVIINFRCGATAPSIDMPVEILFQGDDALDGCFYPITNRLYEINIKEVMGIIVARVGASDYEVIE